MRVLLVSVKSTVPKGGIAVWTDRYLSQCNDYGIDCTLVNTELVGKRAEQGTAKRSLVDEFVRTRRIFHDLGKHLKTDFDAAHLNTSCGTFGLFRDYLIARRIKKKGIPLVTHYHCDISYWIRNPVGRTVLGKLAKLSDRNLVLCQNSKCFLQEHYGLDSVKIPNFVEEAQVLTEQKTIRPLIERVCFVGRVSETKGAAELFAVAKQLPRIVFELIGEVSDVVAAWEKPENILFSGTIPNERVFARLDRADLFLFPSHTEGCSMALMEAMARGVPAIATDVGANVDMLGGDCGVIVAKQAVDDMVAAIHTLEDPARRLEMSRKSVEKIRAHYTDKNVNEIIDIIKKCCGH